jgi:hypothetical protein
VGPEEVPAAGVEEAAAVLVVGVGPEDVADARAEDDPVAESLRAEATEMSAAFAALAWAASSPVGTNSSHNTKHDTHYIHCMYCMACQGAEVTEMPAAFGELAWPSLAVSSPTEAGSSKHKVGEFDRCLNQGLWECGSDGDVCRFCSSGLGSLFHLQESESIRETNYDRRAVSRTGIAKEATETSAAFAAVAWAASSPAGTNSIRSME